jgi:hypothetical protein
MSKLVSLSTLKKQYKLVFIFLLLLVFVNRFLVLFYFGFKFTGSDDLIFWHMAKDYSEGVFHEPFFYGQDYNYPLESIFAVPLIWLNVPYFIALPLVTSLLTVFPFCLFSFVLFRKKYYLNAYVFLLILLAMPIEYEMLTSMSRGFVSGLFFSSFLIFPILEPNKVRSFWILSLSIVLGFIVNPNSVIISLPVCFYLFLINYKRINFYLIFIVVTFPFLFLQYLSKQFYVDNSDYIVHTMWHLTYSFDLLLHTLSNLDTMFKYLTPIYWKGNWMSTLLIAFLGFILLKKDWRKGISIIIGVLFVIFSFGVNKVSDSLGVIYLSSTRMFLAIPLLFGLAIFWWKNDYNIMNSKNYMYIVLAIGCSVFLTKISLIENVVKTQTQETNYGAVSIKSIDKLKERGLSIEEITTKNAIDLVIYIPNFEIKFSEMVIYSYGCSMLNSNLPNALINRGDRRTWIFKDVKNTIQENILIYNFDVYYMDKSKAKTVDYEIIEKHPTMLIIKNNKKSLETLSDIFGFGFKRK